MVSSLMVAVIKIVVILSKYVKAMQQVCVCKYELNMGVKFINYYIAKKIINKM